MAEVNRHFGHMIIDCFRKKPAAVCQIDAATGEIETNGSVLSRSIELANCFRSLGLVPGDVIALGGRNHLDLHIPYYAALYEGLPLVGVDPFFKYDEIKSLLKLTSPKIAFCEPEDYANYAQAAKDLDLQMTTVTFGDGENSMKNFVQKYRNNDSEENFEPAVFGLDKYQWLVSTSGTTGSVKVAAFTTRVWLEKCRMYTNLIRTRENNSDYKPALNLSPVQWISGMFNPVGMPLLGQTMVQTSAPATVEHIIDIINKYKPQQALMSPSVMYSILNHEKECDLTCFKSLIVGGARLPENLLVDIRSRLQPGAMAVEMLGQTETMGPALAPNASTPVGSCGSATPAYPVQLVDPETNKVITDPNVAGELWVKGNIFTEYYNSPEDTAKAFSEDGWYKSGDLMRRDELGNYYYVERLKMLIKYQNYHVSPGELEEVIRRHPDVFDVAVTSVPHPAAGELPVACVVPREGATVREQEIRDLVAKNLSEKKQLRGGVILLKELPLTSTGKISIKQVKEIALSTLKRDNIAS